jgi:hypothetical protein
MKFANATGLHALEQSRRAAIRNINTAAIAGCDVPIGQDRIGFLALNQHGGKFQGFKRSVSF